MRIAGHRKRSKLQQAHMHASTQQLCECLTVEMVKILLKLHGRRQSSDVGGGRLSRCDAATHGRPLVRAAWVAGIVQHHFTALDRREHADVGDALLQRQRKRQCGDQQQQRAAHGGWGVGEVGDGWSVAVC